MAGPAGRNAGMSGRNGWTRWSEWLDPLVGMPWTRWSDWAGIYSAVTHCIRNRRIAIATVCFTQHSQIDENLFFANVSATHKENNGT